MADEKQPNGRGSEADGDAALVARMARGDRPALGVLYERHAPRLLALLLKILGDRAEAEDLLHDVFLEAWRHAAEYSVERGTVSAWLALRTRSRAIDRRRSAPRARSVPLEGSDLPERGDPTADPGRMHDQRRLGDVLSVMSADEREVILLGYFEGLSSTEIAERIGKPVGTVKSRTRSALEKLRGALVGETREP
ncbi:MAG TPA: sigma-70 family RNA polymerase sigma factor [Polyangiaceae bacterium]